MPQALPSVTPEFAGYKGRRFIPAFYSGGEDYVALWSTDSHQATQPIRAVCAPYQVVINSL